MPASSSPSVHPRRAAKYAKPFTPKPVRPVEERVKRLNGSLVDQINDGHFENATKTCRKILRLAESEQGSSTVAATRKTTFKTLLFLLLQTDAYADALREIKQLHGQPTSTSAAEEGSDKTQTQAQDHDAEFEFERAYCLYRLHKEDKALKVLKGLKRQMKAKQGGTGKKFELKFSSEEGRKIGNLEAQISSPERADLEENLNATRERIKFDTQGFRQYLSADGMQVDLDQVENVTPVVPTTSSSAAAASEQKLSATSAGTSTSLGAAEAKKKTKPRHRLPKGAVLGQKFTEDPDRWLPLRQRASYDPNAGAKSDRRSLRSRSQQTPAAGSKKSGKKSGKSQTDAEVAGLTQGSLEPVTVQKQTGASGGKRGKGRKGK